MKTRALLLTALLASTTIMGQAQASEEKHKVGIQLSGGGAEYKGSSKDGDGVGQAYLYYNYQFSPMLALEVGLNGGSEADDWQCTEENDNKFTCKNNDKPLFNLDANKLEYGNLVVAGKGEYYLTKNNSLYAKLGANFYDYDIKQNSKVLNSDDGVGLFAELGWEYDFSNGLGINASYQFMDMGELDTYTLGVGLSYRF